MKTHGDNYEVLNLAYNGDTPTRRIKFGDEILSLKPKLIIWGISYRDFKTNINENPLPDPKYFLHESISEKFHNDITVNPKLITLNFIRDSFNISKIVKDRFQFSNTPFFQYNDHQRNIVDDKLLRNEYPADMPLNLEEPTKNLEVKTLVSLLHKFQQNDVKVILYLTPLQRHYLEIIPEKQNLTFYSTVSYIENQTNIPIYNLQEKYSDAHIWLNTSHVAFNEKSLIYSEDVSKIILDELDS